MDAQAKQGGPPAEFKGAAVRLFNLRDSFTLVYLLALLLIFCF